MTDKNFNPTSPFIAGQLPEFVRIDHPTMVSFLTAYYEWLDADNTYLRSPKKLSTVLEIDNTLEEFISYFKNEYLFGFPEKLAVSEKTNKPVDPVKLMKNIKGFYRAKGTEKTYDFLFRILFDTSVEFYYPKNDIMKLSDGKWVVRRSIKITNNTGKAIFDAVGNTVIQKDASGNILASARVLDVSTYRVGTNDIAELFLGGVNGEFQSGYDGVEFTDKTGVVRRENRIFSVIGKVTVASGGSGYKAGDRVVFTPAQGDTGVRAAGRVGEVDSNGKIRKIIIDNYGVNYKTAPTITVQSEVGTGFVGTVTVSGMSEYQGYYANNDGRLSTNKVIQDSHYYQNFSYVILSEVTIDRYRDILKRLLNPAGLAFFGKVQIKRCAVADLQNSTSLVEYEVPMIGHYAPYTFITNDDLSSWFTDPNTGLLAGYDPTQHDTIIRNDLDGNGKIDFGDIALLQVEAISSEEYYKSIGNPVSGSRAFINPLVPLRTSGFQNADPFWIVYQHPNRKIRGPVTARIPFDLKNEFLNNLGGLAEVPFGLSASNSGTTGYWLEWTEGSSANREEWAAGFTSGERYVTLNYNPLEDYIQKYYEPQPAAAQMFAATEQASSLTVGKFLPRMYYDNVFTYQGQKNLESLSIANDTSVQLAPSAYSMAQQVAGAYRGTVGTNESFIYSDAGEVVGVVEETPNWRSKGLNAPSYLLGVPETPADQSSLVAVTQQSPKSVQFNRFTNYDSETSSHYVTNRSGVETGYMGISGLTATTKPMIQKFVGSLLGTIKGDWNGISGGQGYTRTGKDAYTTDYSEVLATNLESWDAIIAESEGIIDPDNPNSKVNFIMQKALTPIWKGGVNPDGTTFGGLEEYFPNALLGAYGHPPPPPRNVKYYTDYPGLSTDARSSKGETQTNPRTGKTYTSYVSSPTCPDCRWDGRVPIDPNDPVQPRGMNLIWNSGDTNGVNRAFALKLWKEKWYQYAKAAKVWMPSFYIATADVKIEKAAQNLCISEMVKWRKQIFEETGVDDKLIVPFISNKVFTVASGDGGYPTYGIDSLQDLSFLTPAQFVEYYIDPSLSGNPKGSVAGFYVWTGDDTYTHKWVTASTSPYPRVIEEYDASGNLIGWHPNPLGIPYGYDQYWDWTGGEDLKPGAPTGGYHVAGPDGNPRVGWVLSGGTHAGNPYHGGNFAPRWPTASAPARLETLSTMYHVRKNIIAYQAYLDGVTGQTHAQYNFTKPEKYSYLKNSFPTFFDPTTNKLEWSRLKEFNFRVKRNSNDGLTSISLSMAPGTTFAFNHKNVRAGRGVRYRDGVGVTGAIISNPLFNSLTGSSTVFSYSDGKSYQDKGWNTADRIGYVKAVRPVAGDPSQLEIAVEPYFFVGRPVFDQAEGNDMSLWLANGLIDGVTHGLTSGNAVYPTSYGAANPAATDAQLRSIDAQNDPSYSNQRPKWSTMFNPGDIISFGARGATFELASQGQVSGDFRRTTPAERDRVWELVDKITLGQQEAALTRWNTLYNQGLGGDFRIEYNGISDSWFVYGPGNRIIVNGWKPQKSTVDCTSESIKPQITVASNDSDNSVEITYKYTNTCSATKNMEWPDLPPMNLGDSIDYYDTRVSANGVGDYTTFNKNDRVWSANYPSNVYSPVHLVKTKFSGDCCVGNNFAVGVSLLDYSPISDKHDVSMVVYPPQDYPSVALRTTSFDIVTDNNFTTKVIPTTTTQTSKWAASWNTPTYGGATGTTHITTMFAITGRLSSNPQFDEAITGATSAKNFLSSIPANRRVIQPRYLGTVFTDEYVLGLGITLDNVYNTGDACRDSSGNFVTADINDPREVAGRTGSYDGTQRFISPWLDNSAARAKTSWNTWLSEYLAIGGSAQYFVLENENNPTSVWSNWLRKSASDPTTRQVVDHMNYILSDPRSDSLTAGNASVYGSIKTQLKLGAGYTTSQFSNVGGADLAMGASGGYKLWNSVMTGLNAYYIDEFFTSPITSKYSAARISNYDNIRIDETDYVSDLNGHKEYFNADVGNSVAPHLYGEVSQVGTVYEVYSQDATRLDFNSSSSTPFGVTPWSGLILSQQKLRATDRNRKIDDKGLQVWVASVKYYGSNAFGGNVSLHNEYWRENVYHTLLHNPELLLYWNSSSTVAADDKYFHDAIDTVNNITNQRIYNTLDVSNEKLEYNTHFVASGCLSANQNQNIFRVSVNKTTVSILDIDGVKTTLGANETGVWLTTRQECNTLIKKNYDSSTKTLFLSTNTYSANQKYKAYQDKYSFQIATYNESQLPVNGVATLNSGATKTYKVAIKFNTLPNFNLSDNSFILGQGQGQDDLKNAAALETMSPYKNYLDTKYGSIRYSPDYRPVRGIVLAYSELVNPSPTASNYNPYGWDKVTTNYTLAGGYPNTAGYTGVVSYVKNQLENRGWDRAMIWLPSGMPFNKGNYEGTSIPGGYPVRAVSHWTEPNQVYTPPTGSTSVVTNNMDDAYTLLKDMIDVLDDNKRVGFWFGNSPYYQTGFGGTYYPMGSANYDNGDLLSSQVQTVWEITQNLRGIAKGMIGLDSWNPSNAVGGVNASNLQNYDTGILSIYENQIKYITESRNPDYNHRRRPTFLNYYNPNGSVNIKGSFGLGNYLTPNHETWVGMNWYYSTDPAILGFGGDPRKQHERDLARGAEIKKVIDMGLVPVIYTEIDSAYIYNPPATGGATGCNVCQYGCYTLNGLYDCEGCSGCFGCSGCPVTGPTCSGANCCGSLTAGNQCWNTFFGVYDCEGCSGFNGCTGCPTIPQDPCDSCHPGIACLNIMTGLLDCEGCSGCWGCTGCGITAPATGCALCSSVNKCYTVEGIYDCEGCSGCFGCTGCPKGPTGATGCNLCRADAPCWTLSGIYDCEGCSGCFGCQGCTTVTPCFGCECCTGGCFNKTTNLYDCVGCSGCFGCTGCGITGVSAGATSCTGAGGTACCGTTGSGTLCYNIVTGLYDCAGCSGFNGCTGCGITGSLTGCALCSQENPCFTIDGFYDCRGCSGCWGCLGCSITGATSCTGCGCCSTSATGGCFNIVTGLYDCEGCSGCFSCTGCPVTGGCVGCDCCMTGGYNRVTGLKDCVGCSGCYGFTGCGITAPATGCARCSEVNPCYTMNIPSGYDCEGCSGCWQCTGCPVTGPTCSDGQCCGSGGLRCWNTYTGLYDCQGCSGFGGCTGCAVTGASAGPTGCARCSEWEGVSCYNIVTGLYDCDGCSGCFSCTGCAPVIVEPGCTGCSCCSEIYDCFTITGSFDCAGCSGCYNCNGCVERYSKCNQCTTQDCTTPSSVNHQFCVDCGCADIYTNCSECTQLDCDSVTVNTDFCRNTCGCVPTSVLCDECVRNNCNGIRCRTECSECRETGGVGKYTNCNQCLQGDCDFDSSINHQFCIDCGCQTRYTSCSQCLQSDCNDQYSVNHQFCYDCGCTASINCDVCVVNGCVGDGCDLCVDCITQEQYTNCGQCLPIDCSADYRLNHQYCVVDCGCVSDGGTGSTAGNTGDSGPVISAITNAGKKVSYSDFRKITLRSFFEMPVGPEFNCNNQDIQAPPVPQVKAILVNGTNVDTTDWSTDSQYVVNSYADSREIFVNVEGVTVETGSSAGLSSLLYLSYYSGISMWADLFIVDQTGKEYPMASVGPMPTTATSVKITYPFINPQAPNSEPGAVTLGRGIFGAPFKYEGTQIVNSNCIYRLKLYFRNVSNAVIPGSVTVKEFNYQLT